MSPSVEQHISLADQSRPWWRYPIVWMVIGGPAAVVVASLYTAGLAIRHVDPVLDTTTGQHISSSEAPAMKARNHVAEAARQPADR
jgi:hypothetical protein